jgi:HPt (histidine-containing phosphotransfer) domain-containing protein
VTDSDLRALSQRLEDRLRVLVEYLERIDRKLNQMMHDIDQLQRQISLED